MIYDAKFSNTEPKAESYRGDFRALDCPCQSDISARPDTERSAGIATL